jgi:hypothetical protein
MQSTSNRQNISSEENEDLRQAFDLFDIKEISCHKINN